MGLSCLAALAAGIRTCACIWRADGRRIWAAGLAFLGAEGEVGSPAQRRARPRRCWAASGPQQARGVGGRSARGWNHAAAWGFEPARVLGDWSAGASCRHARALARSIGTPASVVGWCAHLLSLGRLLTFLLTDLRDPPCCRCAPRRGRRSPSAAAWRSTGASSGGGRYKRGSRWTCRRGRSTDLGSRDLTRGAWLGGRAGARGLARSGGRARSVGRGLRPSCALAACGNGGGSARVVWIGEQSGGRSAPLLFCFVCVHAQ